MSIRYQVLSPLGLLLIGIFFASWWSANIAAKRAEERVAKQVQQIGLTLQNARFPLTAAVLEQIKQLSGAEFCVYFADGRTLKTKDEEHIYAPDCPIADSPDGELGPLVQFGEQRYRDSVRILKHPHLNAGARVHVLYPESLLKEVIDDAVRPSLINLVLGLLAVVVLFFLADRFVQRIRTIEQRTRTIAAGDFSPMPEVSNHDELHELTQSINAMANNLATWQLATEQNERLRLSTQLASGLAHQLRNGVTGAQLALDIASSDPQDREAIPIAKRQLQMMDANLRRFIDLSRNEPIKLAECDFSAIIQEAVALYQPQAKHANITLVAHWPSHPVFVNGNSGALSDIVVNLVSNAMDAVGQNGTVHVDLKVIETELIFEVRDTGMGPDGKLGEEMFEPFVTGKPEGIGLGLSVVRNAVRLHHGEISWFRDHQETVFRVVWPSSIFSTLAR